jgi:hypothetical protein
MHRSPRRFRLPKCNCMFVMLYMRVFEWNIVLVHILVSLSAVSGCRLRQTPSLYVPELSSKQSIQRTFFVLFCDLSTGV